MTGDNFTRQKISTFFLIQTTKCNEWQSQLKTHYGGPAISLSITVLIKLQYISEKIIANNIQKTSITISILCFYIFNWHTYYLFLILYHIFHTATKKTFILMLYYVSHISKSYPTIKQLSYQECNYIIQIQFSFTTHERQRPHQIRKRRRQAESDTNRQTSVVIWAHTFLQLYILFFGIYLFFFLYLAKIYRLPHLNSWLFW